MSTFIWATFSPLASPRNQNIPKKQALMACALICVFSMNCCGVASQSAWWNVELHTSMFCVSLGLKRSCVCSVQEHSTHSWSVWWCSGSRWDLICLTRWKSWTMSAGSPSSKSGTGTLMSSTWSGTSTWTLSCSCRRWKVLGRSASTWGPAKVWRVSVSKHSVQFVSKSDFSS